MSVEGPEANALAHLEWARKAYDERKAENQTAALLARILGELQQIKAQLEAIENKP